jgi:5'-3' exonuclease
MKYVIIDATHLYFRAKHVVRGDDIDMKIGMAMQIMFSSINKVWRDFGADHLVCCFEGGSWRKDFYGPYKRNRAERTAGMSMRELEEDKQFLASFNDFRDFLSSRSNATVLAAPGAEADDCIARWIQTHSEDEHVIISADSDFYQLLTPNVTQYNGITQEHITLDGIYDAKGSLVIDKKTKAPKSIGDPEWLLFEKCIRGDKADNIFSAYPGARKKGTKNKTGMQEAFDDRNKQGYHWNNLMLVRWIDINNEEHVVRNDYIRNKKLIDLTEQPENVLQSIDMVINNAITADKVSQCGLHFLRFCGKYNLVRLGEQCADHSKYLSAAYTRDK